MNIIDKIKAEASVSYAGLSGANLKEQDMSGFASMSGHRHARVSHARAGQVNFQATQEWIVAKITNNDTQALVCPLFSL